MKIDGETKNKQFSEELLLLVELESFLSDVEMWYECLLELNNECLVQSSDYYNYLELIENKCFKVIAIIDRNYELLNNHLELCNNIFKKLNLTHIPIVVNAYLEQWAIYYYSHISLSEGFFSVKKQRDKIIATRQFFNKIQPEPVKSLFSCVPLKSYITVSSQYKKKV